MEMPVDREDFDFEVFETDDVTPAKKLQRLCPQCSSAVTGRPNKIFCTPNCRKRHSEPTRNSYFGCTGTPWHVDWCYWLSPDLGYVEGGYTSDDYRGIIRRNRLVGHLVSSQPFSRILI